MMVGQSCLHEPAVVIVKHVARGMIVTFHC
jgi:hypothetical protein